MTQKNTVVIYHGNCADGLGAAWACWQKFGESADYLPCQYGTKLDDLINDYVDIQEDTYDSQIVDIYIVDFSFPQNEILVAANNFFKTITVLDHHKSARDELTGEDKIWPPNVDIVFDMDRSGAGIAWDYLNVENRDIKRQMQLRPDLINLIEDRDLWRFNFHASKGFHKLLTIETDNFHADLKSFKYLDNLHKNPADFSEAVLKGLSVQEYHDSVIAGIAKGTVQHTPFDNSIGVDKTEGCIAFVINAPYFAVSDLGEYLGIDCDVVISWHIRNSPDNVALSFRSKNGFDCQAFAKKYFNGGGHEAAAGGHCTIEEWLAFLRQGKLPDASEKT